MKLVVTSLFLVLFFWSADAQQAPYPPAHTADKIVKSRKPESPRREPPEICTNNTDDNGNELVDMKDFSCFFNSITPTQCHGSNIVWISSGGGLYWVDIETGQEKRVGVLPGIIADDITWTPQGKLYAADRITGSIFEINPYTSEPSFVADVAGHYYTNAMTSDANGNLIMASKVPNGDWHIVRLNPNTGQTDVLGNLSFYGLESAGDVTFYQGFLYITCNNNKIARIDIGSGQMQTSTIVNSPTENSFGLVTLADGNLYFSNINQLYKLDPGTLEASLYYTYQNSDIHTLGLTTYGEFCEAPACRPNLVIEIESPLPYCSDAGVMLRGNGTGINGGNHYTWRLPDGTQVNGNTLKATVSGTYSVRFHSLPDTCGTEAFIDLDIGSSPDAFLGENLAICENGQLLLQPLTIQAGSSYLWQNGSSIPQLLVTQPGLYWLQASNTCGSVRDTVIISEALPPIARIGNDTSLCANNWLELQNSTPKQAWDNYTWSTGSQTESIQLADPGIYWLEVTNDCGAARDSIIITAQNACICTPLVPALQLGIDREICPADTLILRNNLHQPGFNYQWQDGSDKDFLVVNGPGIYWTSVSTACGTLKDSVIVKEKLQDCECLLFIPSAFTPNRDGLNDLLQPTVNCSIKGELSIFNRWGQMLFRSTDLSKGWNGYYQGRLQPNDAYVYYLRYWFTSGSSREMHQKKGSVLLLR